MVNHQWRNNLFYSSNISKWSLHSRHRITRPLSLRLISRITTRLSTSLLQLSLTHQSAFCHNQRPQHPLAIPTTTTLRSRAKIMQSCSNVFSRKAWIHRTSSSSKIRWIVPCKRKHQLLQQLSKAKINSLTVRFSSSSKYLSPLNWNRKKIKVFH